MSKLKMYSFRLDEEFIVKLDEWRAAQEVEPNRSDVIRVAVEQFIASHPIKPAKKKAIPKNRLPSSDLVE